MNHIAVAAATQKISSPPLVQGLLQRQCHCGNHTPGGGQCAACAKKKRMLQRQLAIGAVNDPLEQEADRIADQVLSSGASATAGTAPLSIQRYTPSVVSQTLAPAPATVDAVLASSGTPLESGLRQSMEQRFGHDFSSVRVHTGGAADQSARDVNANAYTVGHSIVFAAGRFAPATQAGQRLLAHELTHVVQQSRGSGAATGVLRRQTRETQLRGGAPQLATLELPPRGEDRVRMHVFRYLCDCQGRNFRRSRRRVTFSPPGVVFQVCEGFTTREIRGRLTPSSQTTGAATVTAGVNVAPGKGRPGVRAEVEGEARNTGSEPEIGARARTRVGTDRTSVVGEGEVFVGTKSGNVQSRVGGGVQIRGTTITGSVTNPGSSNQGVQIGIGGRFGGPTISREICRECICPTAYECIEDVPPRPYPEDVPYNVEDRERHCYYFRLNSVQDTRNSELRALSQQLFAKVQQRLSEGWAISEINGYASPEAGEAELNRDLSARRGQRLRELLQSRLPADTPLVAPNPGGELLGSRSSILPSAKLSDTIVRVGFRSPEEASNLLIGDEILNDRLADQFLDLFNQLTDPADRVALFGIAMDSPLAAQLLQAIDQFIARRGRGFRPWERIFEYLRFANVVVTRIRTEPRTETRHTSGSVRSINQDQCLSFAAQAENEDRFGPAERPPSVEECPDRPPRNPERFANLCDYEG